MIGRLIKYPFAFIIVSLLTACPYPETFRNSSEALSHKDLRIRIQTFYYNTHRGKASGGPGLNISNNSGATIQISLEQSRLLVGDTVIVPEGIYVGNPTPLAMNSMFSIEPDSSLSLLIRFSASKETFREQQEIRMILKGQGIDTVLNYTRLKKHIGLLWF